MNRSKKTVNGLCMALCVTISLFITSDLQAKTKMLSITSTNDKVVVKNFRISKVVDDRLETNSIGYLTTGAHNYFLPANFRQSLPDEINQFLNESTAQSTNAEEVTLHVYDYLLFEKSSFKGAEIALHVHYAIFNKSGDRIIDYSNVDTRNTGMNMGANAGELMRRSMVNYLTEIDAKIAPVLALYRSSQPIKVSYVFVKEPAQKNLLPYNPSRPLNVYNFVAKAPEATNAPSEAECGLMVNYQVRHVDGKAEAFIELLPYFNQAKSWIKTGDDLKKKLAYEQTYFKISAFVTNELIKELQAKSFTFSNLKKDIDELREKYIARMKSLQQQYQMETEYGNNMASMEKWNRQIAFYPAYASN
jgi:hypothetical protein